MSRPAWFGVLALFLAAFPGPSPADCGVPVRTACPLAGTLIDHTHNHGADRRIWSEALLQWRDLYVYLPPGFDPGRRYPVLIWLHGIYQDERSFLEYGLKPFDEAMASGQMPPSILAIPDGTLTGELTLRDPRTLFLNSRLGRFEDLVVHDVLPFLRANYPICPDRQAHLIGGFSGGGFSAYRIAIRHRGLFGSVFAFCSPLNLRWLDCHGRYFSQFDPSCWGWRNHILGPEVVGRFYGGLIVARIGSLIFPLYGRGPEAMAAMSQENPIEMLDRHDVRPGELAMYIAYGGKDQFNVTAQVESFLYRAAQRQLPVTVSFDPEGRHDTKLVRKFLPEFFAWLSLQLKP